MCYSIIYGTADPSCRLLGAEVRVSVRCLCGGRRGRGGEGEGSFMMMVFLVCFTGWLGCSHSRRREGYGAVDLIAPMLYE